MDNKEYVGILSDLVGFKTVSGNTAVMTHCYNYIDSKMGFYDFHRRSYSQNGVESRVWSTENTLTPDILLNAHIDVVDVDKKDEMFTLSAVGDKLFGRGVSDMKFAVPTFIGAMRSVLADTGRLPSIAMMLTSDEESGGPNGVGHLVKDVGYRPKFVFTPDGGDNNKIVEKAKGVFHLQIDADGVTSHASKPWEGHSANDKLIEAIVKLRKRYPIPTEETWADTLNIGTINGGTQTNMLNGSASMTVDLRYNTDHTPEQIMSEVNEFASGCRVTEKVHAVSYKIDYKEENVQLWSKITKAQRRDLISESGSSDARYFAAVGIPTLVTKPIGGLIHNPGEFLSLDSAMEFTDNLAKFIKARV